jgi:hypothetical protein
MFWQLAGLALGALTIKSALSSSGRSSTLSGISSISSAIMTVNNPSVSRPSAKRPAAAIKPLKKRNYKKYEIINSEGEYITIDTETNELFRGLTWDYLISNFIDNREVVGTVAGVAAKKEDSRKILGYYIKFQVFNSKKSVRGFLPMRFANIDMNQGDIVYCKVKEFDPIVNKHKYNLVLTLANTAVNQ